MVKRRERLNMYNIVLETNEATVVTEYTPLRKRRADYQSEAELEKTFIQDLDRFESLCTDITSGLPAEIEARHKQYEYYRDKLLTFKRKGA